jgi:hypothetical protein
MKDHSCPISGLIILTIHNTFESLPDPANPLGKTRSKQNTNSSYMFRLRGSRPGRSASHFNLHSGLMWHTS